MTNKQKKEKYALLLANLTLKEEAQRYASGERVNSAQSAVRVLEPLKHLDSEHFFVITLDSSLKPRRLVDVTKGLLNRCLVHPREVFYEAVHDLSHSIIVAHNHPSGGLNPSSEDDDITKRLVSAGELLGINVLDHIIIAGDSYYSYSEEGKI